jgi:hypothetical protein
MRGARWPAVTLLRIALALMATATLAPVSLAAESSPGNLVSAEAMPGAPEPIAFSVLMPGIGRAFIARDAADAAVAWMAARFAGEPAPTNCGASL